MDTLEWKIWDLEDWNDFLVQIYFRPDDAGGETIHQFDASFSYLAKKLGIAADDGCAAQNYFVSTFQVPRNELRNLFDASHAVRGWTEESDNLPFFGQLYLSLIVASATEETQEEGNFRERFSRILGQNVPQNYVNCLPRLWEAARAWSVVQAKSSINSRVLVLPAPGHEIIIGYSKRLAFPSYRDHTCLASVLTNRSLSSQSPINQLIDAVGSNRRRFSAVFQEELDLFVRGIKSDPKNAKSSEMPFWRAIESTTWQSISGEGSNKEHALCLELSLTSEEAVVVQAAANESYAQSLNGTWQTSLIDDYDDIYSCYIDKAINQSDSPAAVAAILEDQNPALLSLIRGKSLAQHIDQGCIVFAREDAFTWRNHAAMPPNGQVCLLLRSELASKAIQEVKRYGGSSLRQGPIEDVKGWLCLGPIEVDKAVVITGLPIFRDFLALQPALPTSQIRLIGGLKLPDGLLFLRPVMPTVIASRSEFIRCISTNGSSAKLTRTGVEGQVEYQFTPSNINAIPLPSKIRLVAYADNELIRAKSINVVDRCSINRYKFPSDATHWLKEGAHGQLVSWGTGSDNIAGEGVLSPQALNDINGELAKQSAKPALSAIHTAAEWVSLEELPQVWSDLFESIAAVMTRKGAVGWAQLCELINAGLSISNNRHASDVVDALIQNGFIQRVYNRRWIGLRLLGVQPEQHVIDGPDEGEKRIVGLLSASQRDALFRFASERSARMEIARLSGTKIFGVTRLVGGDLSGLAQAIDINDAKNSDMWSPIRILPSPKNVLSHSSMRSAARVGDAESRWWDAAGQGFYLENHNESDLYALSFRRFSNQISSYSLFDRENLVWQTEDRSWAIFVFSRLAAEPNAISLHKNTLITKNPMPLGLAHFTILQGSGVVGFHESEGVCHWSYPVAKVETVADWLTNWGLGLEGERSSLAMQRWVRGFRHTERNRPAKGSYAFSKRYL